MKNSRFVLSIGLFVSLLTGSLAFADSVSFGVGPMKGLVKTKGSLTLVSAQAVLTCGYCKSSTCAGGPRDKKELNSRLSAMGNQTYSLDVASGSLNSNRFFATLDACSYSLAFEGVDTLTKEEVSGDVVLVSSKANSPQPIWENDRLSELLSQKLQKSPLKLEIRKGGFNGPRIAEEAP